MKKFFGRESKVEKYSKEHVDLVYECFQSLEELMLGFYTGNKHQINHFTKQIGILEHKADELRRKMEIEFYEGAFLPFDREDRIILAEMVDSVADGIESAAFEICLSKVEFPSAFEEDFKEMMDLTGKTILTLKECIAFLEEDLGKSIKKAHEIEDLEDQTDIVERRIIKKLYNSYRSKNIGILKLLELKESTKKIANITDRAEDASDRALIIAAKRRG
ncbi:TIGR00153 family protein [Methanobacterium alcaliphilum]|uniref:TIGR00153 family protein n=1 Tax=Methanobacterium alcaliphilum TaxID=392018 RepID=UPI00200B49BD|nr:TIGR00153 family protein [Methanobacterium alcaliphilum]MCK9152200.1 TIGR00153 family protein [Methanobacterium alcaliphilum]